MSKKNQVPTMKQAKINNQVHTGNLLNKAFLAR
jgi:hypothetical protein